MTMKVPIMREIFLPAHMPAPKNERISRFIFIAMVSKTNYVKKDYQ